MKTINISFSKPIRYTNIDCITEENGIYYIFQKIYNENYNDYNKDFYFYTPVDTDSYLDLSIYSDKPLYIGKSYRNESSEGIRGRIKEHFNSKKDKKIYDYIEFYRSNPKDNYGVFTKNNNLDNIGKPPAIFITTCTNLKSEYEIELVEAALIYSNKMLYLNEQNTKSYDRETVTIKININTTYGLNSENIAIKNT